MIFRGGKFPCLAKKENNIDITSKILKLRSGHPENDNRNGYWTDKEDKDLLRMFYDGVGITEIAVILGRTEPSVVQRLLISGAFQRQTRPRAHKDPSEKKPPKDPKCRCEKCRRTDCVNHGKVSVQQIDCPELQNEEG